MKVFLEENNSIVTDAFLKYRDVLVSEMYRYTGDYAMAEDCVQEAFIVLLKTIKDGRYEELNTRKYLLSISKRCVSKRRETLIDPFDIVDMGDSTNLSDATVVSQLESLECEEIIEKLLSYISPNERQLLIMKYAFDMKYDEISKILDMNAETVRKTVRKSVKTLRKKLKENEYVYK